MSIYNLRNEPYLPIKVESCEVTTYAWNAGNVTLSGGARSEEHTSEL